MQSVQQSDFNIGLFAAMAFLNFPDNRLVKLCGAIDWDSLENAFSKYYSDGVGRKSLPVRLLAGLLILKHLDNHSDESVIRQWQENVCYQLFTGNALSNTVFQTKAPCDSSTLVKFRDRIGPEGIEQIFKISVEMHVKLNEMMQKPTVLLADTTVQEKNISFPTDHKLIFDAIKIIAKIGVANDIPIVIDLVKFATKTRKEINFSKGKGSLQKRAKALNRLRKCGNDLLKIVFHGLNDTARKEHDKTLALCKQAINQKKNDKNKIYSLYEPDVKCICKGKTHKKYEFGSKVSIAMELKSGVIVAAINHPDNPYDGHTLEPLVNEARKNLDHANITHISCDLGYRGVNMVDGIMVVTPDILKDNNYTKKQREEHELLVKKRSGVEVPFSHMKYSYRLGRNFLHGTKGDAINLFLAATAYNLAKYLRHVLGCDIPKSELQRKRDELNVKMKKMVIQRPPK
jgi:IS5 family transposase